MTTEYQRHECLDFIAQKISKSGDWRTAQSLRFPGDERNRRAAERLKELAATATELPDDVWEELKDHYHWSNEKFGEVVSLTNRTRHDPHNVWGCTTGAGQYIGSTAEHRKNTSSPLRVYKTPINWLLANCEGILPLAKGFFPLLQHASSIIAEGYEHACEISELAFMVPAERLFLDCDAAEQAALNKITFEVAA